MKIPQLVYGEVDVTAIRLRAKVLGILLRDLARLLELPATQADKWKRTSKISSAHSYRARALLWELQLEARTRAISKQACAEMRTILQQDGVGAQMVAAHQRTCPVCQKTKKAVSAGFGPPPAFDDDDFVLNPWIVYGGLALTLSVVTWVATDFTVRDSIALGVIVALLLRLGWFFL